MTSSAPARALADLDDAPVRAWERWRSLVARHLPSLLILLFTVALVRTAWVSDDAYISMRTVDNFVNGYGLRWNVDERVQTFTHPLWLLLVSPFYAATREAYFTLLALSFAASIAAVWIYASRVAASRGTAAGGVLLLILSKAFMDYSTSGLENPLTHLLVVLFVACWFSDRIGERRLFAMAAIAGLLALDRLDSVALVAPALVAAVIRSRPRAAVGALLAGFAPFAAWELFSLFYYGMPFPNTAYAKLGGEVLAFERAAQGIFYLIDAFAMDPLTPVVILLGIALPLVLGDRESWPLAAGLVLSVIYVVAIGGDFMSGRMLSAAFFAAVMILSRRQWQGRLELALVPVALAAMLGFGATDPDLLTNRNFRHDGTDRDGIVDERRVYFPWTGLLNVMHGVDPLSHPWGAAGRQALARGDRVVVWGANGLYGFVAGRRLHIIDRFALGDALLARLPAEAGWYAGHLARRLPDGYMDSVATGQNKVVEPGVHAFYERIRLITRGPLFDARRMHAIWRLNVDGFRNLLAGTTYDEQQVRARDLAVLGADPSDAPVRVRERGVVIDLEQTVKGRPLEIITDGNDDFFVIFRLGGDRVGTRVVHRARPAEPSTPHASRVTPPSEVAFDRVLIRPRRTWGPMGLWSVRLEP